MKQIFKNIWLFLKKLIVGIVLIPVKVFNWLIRVNMAEDKMKHFIVGVRVSVLTVGIFSWWGVPVAIAGFLYKEARDKKKGGNFDFWDFWASLMGLFAILIFKVIASEGDYIMNRINEWL